MDIEERRYRLHRARVLRMVEEIALAGGILGLPAKDVKLEAVSSVSMVCDVKRGWRT